METPPQAATVRSARPGDLDAVIALDAEYTGLAKPDYWADMFARYVAAPRPHRFFLIAEGERRVLGFVVGEIRAWEFGSPPCGWVFAINVVPDQRERGIGTLLFDAICKRLQAAGVNAVRTMLSRRDTLNMAFFRSQGMTAGNYIQLERSLDTASLP